jgi:hypothetical protein
MESECRARGFKKDSKEMSDCVVNLAVKDQKETEMWSKILAGNPETTQQQLPGNIGMNGTPVYNINQCTGPIIMGVCHGSTVGMPIAICRGTMLNGQCIGPLF